MKIDFYISSLSCGGAEKVLVAIASQMAASGHDAAIISLEKKPQFYKVSDTVSLVKVCSRGKMAAVKDFFRIQSRIKKGAADVSVSFLSRCNCLVLLCSLFRKNRVIVCDRNNPLKEHSKLVFCISSLLYMRADRIVVQTNQIRNYYWRVLKPKIRVIENCIDTGALDSQLTGPVEREKVILSMGRLEKQKDFKTLIRAFSGISRKYPGWKVKIFGDGSMRTELQHEIRKYDLERQVFLCGKTEKPYEQMCRASIFVLSSFYEGFPNVLCEALYAGDLCISADCVSGPAELISHGENGWLFPVGDQEKLAGLLDELISSEQGLEETRRRAEESVKRLYLEKNIVRWEELMQEVVCP